ncbi:MAG TPA: hypothetical protein VFP71_06580 [Candidatus Angelobacter sp.]|nr:hypothetical protein [Candidatus Angelobacter sp.]
MNAITLSQITRKACCAVAAPKTLYLAVFLICAAVLSFGQSGSLSITVSGPFAFKDTPVVPSYKVTVANTSQAIASNITLANALSTTDGAYLIAAQPSQGTCDPGGQGISSLSCSLGNLDPGASITVDVVAQMFNAAITLSSSATGIDGNGAAFSIAPVSRATVHGNPPAGTTVASISLSANPVPKDLVGGRTGTLNWTFQNSTGIRANKLTMVLVIDNRMRITSSVVTGSNSSDPVSCTAPAPGVFGTNVITCNIDYLGGSSNGSGGSATVTQLQVTVNYISPVVSSQTTLFANGYLSFDGTDSSNPIATGQVRVK